jgi:hypothetical protein
MIARGHGHFVDVRLLLWKRAERAEGRATEDGNSKALHFA